VLPVAVGVLAIVLAAQVLSVRAAVTAVAGVFLLGGAAFLVVPLVQTWLMGEVGDAAAGLAASANISAAGVAGAVGAALGGAVIAGPGAAWIGPVAALPVAAAAGVAALLGPVGGRFGARRSARQDWRTCSKTPCPTPSQG